MGLILSILVVFVSVVELLTVYSNFRTNLQPVESNRDFSPLIRRYEAGLHKERRRILKIIEEYRKFEETTSECPDPPVEKPSTSCCTPQTPNHIQAKSPEDQEKSNAGYSRTPSPNPIPAVPRNSVCNDYFDAQTIGEFSGKHKENPSEEITIRIETNVSFGEESTSIGDLSPFFDLQSETFDSPDYWPNRTQIENEKKRSKGKSLKESKKRMKFGLSLEEFEPDWSRAPSPIFKIPNNSPDPTSPKVSSAPLKKSKAVNFKSLQITDLNEQIVPGDYWRRSPSPFREFIDISVSSTPEENSWDANKQIIYEDEDGVEFPRESSRTLDGLKIRPLDDYPSTESWNPNKEIISSDEDKEPPPSFDEDYINTLDGLKSTKSDDKKRSFRRKRKTPKQNSLETESKQQNGFAHSEDEVTVVDKNALVFTQELENICTAEKKEIIEYSGSDEGTSNTDRNAASNAFWLIFSGEYTKAMNKDWHGQHFCCWQCDESLTGQRYVLREEHPYCVACYESVFANSCEKCSRTIGIDSKDLSYKDKHWHEACFLCATCGDSLVDKQFGSKGDRIYCGRCYDEQFASRCDGCGQIFRAGTKKMEYKTRQWHEKCFCCCVCKTPIGTQSFIPREQEIYCAKCYEEKYATRCIKCNKVITSGGVTYKNEPWHRECFTCTNCNTSLAGARFTSRDDKPYCAECFGELFAKRCTACNKPITGIGGTKFISFEDRHWHNDCFFCASCRTSLVGRGFITDGDDIICPECAKQKLM